MPVESAIFVACVVVAFTIFAVSLAYAHYITVIKPDRSNPAN